MDLLKGEVSGPVWRSRRKIRLNCVMSLWILRECERENQTADITSSIVTFAKWVLLLRNRHVQMIFHSFFLSMGKKPVALVYFNIVLYFFFHCRCCQVDSFPQLWPLHKFYAWYMISGYHNGETQFGFCQLRRQSDFLVHLLTPCASVESSVVRFDLFMSSSSSPREVVTGSERARLKTDCSHPASQPAR